MIAEYRRLRHISATKSQQNWRSFAARYTVDAGGQRPLMMDALDYAPVAATAFAVPQFLPQILKLRATHDTDGVSWSGATLTSLNNAAWIAYFAFERYWTALVPSSSATLLAGMLAKCLPSDGRRSDDRRP